MFDYIRECPRPDFVRENWVSLNGEWDFSFDSDTFDMKIQVPFVYQSKRSGVASAQNHDVVWYRRGFQVDEEKMNKGRVLLHFGAVDYEAGIYINGQFAGTHRGGHTSFTFDISDFVKAGENELKVRVYDGNETDRPRGKQTWTGELFGCWYTPTTGIWQTVWLEYTGQTYIRRIKITPDLNRNQALYEFYISGPEECVIKAETAVDSVMTGTSYDLGTNTVSCKNGYGKCILAFPDMDLARDRIIWSLECPNLIYVKSGLYIGDRKEDEVLTYYGMRSVELKERKFYLNGNVCVQRLILDQGYWPDSLLTPPDIDALEKDIRIAQEMGFNGARKHQKIEDPRYYYLADKLGFLVWGELPSCYMFNDNTVKNSVSEMTEFLERDFNHPSIVTWVPMNESWGVRNIRTDVQQQAFSNLLIYLVKSYDSTRPVSGNDGWEQTNDTDILAIHDYALMASTMNQYDDIETVIRGAAESRAVLADGHAYRGQPVIMTEYGGVAFAGENDGWGYYGKISSSEEFINRVAPVTEYMIKSGRFAGFCYTQLTDVMQEKNGLLTEAREPKIEIMKLREIFGKKYYE